jgi:hypothetical protein
VKKYTQTKEKRHMKTEKNDHHNGFPVQTRVKAGAPCQNEKAENRQYEREPMHNGGLQEAL